MAEMSSKEHRPLPSCQGFIDMLATLIKTSECLAFFQGHAQQTKEIGNVDSIVLKESPQEQLSTSRAIAALKDTVEVVRDMTPILR